MVYLRTACAERSRQGSHVEECRSIGASGAPLGAQKRSGLSGLDEMPDDQVLRSTVASHLPGEIGRALVRQLANASCDVAISQAPIRSLDAGDVEHNRSGILG
jgi:hypothetical protein